MTTRLGFTQRAVLTSLAAENRSADHISYDWPWISTSAARSAITRLSRRSLVDVAGWDGDRRTYKITTKGLAAIDGFKSDDDEIEG